MLTRSSFVSSRLNFLTPLSIFIFSLIFSAPISFGTVEAQEVLSIITEPENGTSRCDRQIDLSSDINRDGVNDIAEMYIDTKGLWQVAFYDAIRGTVLRNFSDNSLACGYDSTFSVGDITGDGVPDVVLGEGYYYHDYVSGTGACVLVKDGATGAEIYKSQAEFKGSGCGAKLQVTDLDRDGRSELIVMERDASDGGALFVLKYDPALQTLTQSCRALVDRESLGSITSFYAGPDSNGDGYGDLFIGLPEASSKTGMVMAINGRTCQELKRIDGPAVGAELGLKIFATGDENGDGRAEYQVLAKDLLFTGRGSNGDLYRASAVKADYTNQFSGSGDLNFDGVLDLVRRPNYESSCQILSGATGDEIGHIGIGDEEFIERIGKMLNASGDDWQRYVSIYGINSHHRFDINRDEIADLLTLVSIPFYNNAIGRRDYRAYLVALSGACPIQAEMKILARDGWAVAEGANRIEISAKVCGKSSLLGAYKLTHGGTLFTPHDDGKDGDSISGDGIYTSAVTYGMGAQPISIVGKVLNEVLIPVSVAQSVIAVKNYVVAAVPYGWIDSEGGADIPLVWNSPTTQISAPFPIKFYNGRYSDLWVSSQGYIVIGESNEKIDSSSHQRLPTDKHEQRILAPFWGSIGVSGSARLSYKTIGTPGTRQFVITWEGFEYSNYRENPSSLSFQVSFDEQSGAIRMNYRQTWAQLGSYAAGAGATSGLQDNSRLGKTFAHSEPSLPDRTSIIYLIPGDGNGGGGGGGGDNGGGDNGGGGGDNGGGDNGGGGGGGGGGGDNGGGGATPQNLKVSLAIVRSPKTASATMDLLTTDLNTGGLADISAAQCVFDLYATEAIASNKITLKYVASMAAGSGRVSKKLTKLAGITRKMVRDAKGKQRDMKGYLLAQLKCPNQANINSNVVTVASSSTRIPGLQIGALAWLKRVIKAVTS